MLLESVLHILEFEGIISIFIQNKLHFTLIQVSPAFIDPSTTKSEISCHINETGRLA